MIERALAVFSSLFTASRCRTYYLAPYNRRSTFSPLANTAIDKELFRR
jgi:hypothetical protein